MHASIREDSVYQELKNSSIDHTTSIEEEDQHLKLPTLTDAKLRTQGNTFGDGLR